MYPYASGNNKSNTLVEVDYWINDGISKHLQTLFISEKDVSYNYNLIITGNNGRYSANWQKL